MEIYISEQYTHFIDAQVYKKQVYFCDRFMPPSNISHATSYAATKAPPFGWTLATTPRGDSY